MAAITATSALAAPATFSVAKTSRKEFSGLKAAPVTGKSLKDVTVSNGSRVSCMKVWPPYGNQKFETLSYLPPLTDRQIMRQIDYMLANNWIPCLEFDQIGVVSREHYAGSGYYDGRYWTMWKLPMFGCSDSFQVIREVQECINAYPDAYIRVLGFDNVRQVQVLGFLVHKP